MSGDEVAGPLPEIQSLTDTDVQQRDAIGLAPLQKPRIKKILRSDVMLRKIIRFLAQQLPQLAAKEQWLPLKHATQFLLWAGHHVPGAAANFIAVKGTARVQAAVRAAAVSRDPSAVCVLQPGTALLLLCVRLSESAADLVVESQSVRLLLQLLTRPDVGPTTKRHTGDILQALAATKLVYRDVLHGAGVVDALMEALTDAAVLADLQLLQKLLWVQSSLSDDDLVYKDDMREAGLPAVLVALFSVYQANQGAAELRPIAAQMLRCLHLMAHGDKKMQSTCRQLGLIPLLLSQLHLDIHQMDEPPLPAAAAHILTLSSLPGTPRSPGKDVSRSGVSAGGLGSPFTPGSPLRRSGSSSGSSSPRAVTASGSRRPSAVEPPIPEETEMEDVDLPESPAAGGKVSASSSSSMVPGAVQYGGRSAGFTHSSEASALRALGAGPSAVSRVAAAVLLREVLRPVMSSRTVEVLLHGMMLPALYMQLVGPRVSLAMEASATLRALLTDHPDNQAVAVKAGVVPLLVQLLSVRNVDLASTAADILNLLAASGDAADSTVGALGSHTAPAVLGLTELLKGCAAHAYAVGLSRRRSQSGSAVSDTPVTVSGGILDRKVTGTEREHSLSPVQEMVESSALAPSSSNSAYPTVGLGLLGAGSAAAPTAAEQVAATLWSGDAQQQITGAAVRHRSLDFRQPSLSHDVTPTSRRTSNHVSDVPSNGNISSRPSLTSRERISGIIGGGQCLVCGNLSHESCGFCPLSSAVVSLCTLLRPQQQQLQHEVMCAGGVEVVVGLLAGEVVHVWDHHRLVAALAHLLTLVVQGNTQAQDQVRHSGGVDIVSEALERLTAAADDQSLAGGLLPLAVGLLQLLTVLVSGNSANKLCVREAGVFKGVAALVDVVLAASGSQLEPLSHALLHFLIMSAQDSPGCQTEAVHLGIITKLMSLLRAPTNDYAVGYLIIQALALLATSYQPAALTEVTAGGLVSVVMNVLQQQAMAGVLVSEVCMNALPSLLNANETGKQQALGYGVLPLLVHLLRSSPSSVTVVSAARTLTVLAGHNTELQGQIISAGGLQALLDKLDPANAAAAAATSVQAATAAAASAAAEAAAEAVAKAAADAGSSCNAVTAAHSEISADISDAAGQQPQSHLPLPAAADGIFSAVASRDQSTPDGNQQQLQQPSQVSSPEQAALLKLQQKLAQLQVRVACLEAVGTLAHDNMFTKNTARQEGVMLLLGTLLQQGKGTLHRLVATAQQQQAVVPPDSAISLQHGPLRVRTPRSSHQQLQVPAAPTMTAEQVLEHQIQATELQLLSTSVNVLKELCHGAHSNQQAAAAGGLIDQLTDLAALALGSSLEAAAAHGQLLAALADALAAVCEFCFPNKLMARESGIVDVLSRAILMAAEAPDMSVLGTLRLFPAIASCCGAVAALAADCDDDQSSFTSNPDFMPALFRLLSVQDPILATQAARALEHVAIRNDYVEDADDRSEFEADTIMGLIRTLSHGAITVSGSGRAAAARVAVGGAAGTPSSAVVKEAADLLSRVVYASDPAVISTPATGGAGGVGSSSTPSRTVSGLGTAPAHPATQPAATSSAKQLAPAASLNKLGRQPQQQQQQQQQQDTHKSEGTSGPGGVDIISPRPSALLPTVMTDHNSGLAVLRTWSVQEDVAGLWQHLVAKVAPAFQPIAAGIADGPWKPFKQQMAWMLLLLAAKNVNNRAIISKVQRTTLTPLAMQLENAERFHQQAAAEQAAAEMATAGRDVTRTSSAAAGVAASAVAGENSRPNSSGGFVSGGRPLSGTSSAPLESSLLPSSGAAGNSAAAASAGIMASSGDAPESSAAETHTAGQGNAAEDDELSMLQAEVAFLGLMSSSSSNGHKGATFVPESQL